MSNSITKSERKIVGFGLIVSAVFIVAALFNVITYNPSPSAPMGFYLRAPKSMGANYITFCLRLDQQDAPFYALACSPDRPHHTRILKRIDRIDLDHGYWVVSTHPQAIDSDVVGWVKPEQIRGHWVPLITWKAAR